MAVYTLTVLTTSLGLGVISGARVSMEKMRAVMANSYPPTNNLYRIELPTDVDGLCSFPLEPDDASTFHTAKIFDTEGVLVYQKRFSMPPQALNLEDSAYDVVTSGSVIQFQDDGTNLGTPTTVRNVNFIGTVATLLNYSLDVEITPASIGADTVGSAATAEQAAKDYADSGLALKLDANDYVQHFLGKYASLGVLQTAHATAINGDYAIVDAGSGSNARQYVWDVDDGWIDSGDIKTGTTSDQISEGSSNLYFTSTRVRDAVLTGLDLATNAVISATDTVLSAFGKLQKQITDLTSSLSSYATTSSLTSDLLANLTPTINTQTGTSYTLLTADNDGKSYVRMANASANTVTITTALTKPVSISQQGAGTTTLVAGAGVTLNGTLAFSAQYQTKTVIPIGSGVFDVVG